MIEESLHNIQQRMADAIGSTLDGTVCNNWVDICPGPGKA